MYCTMNLKNRNVRSDGCSPRIVPDCIYNLCKIKCNSCLSTFPGDLITGSSSPPAALSPGERLRGLSPSPPPSGGGSPRRQRSSPGPPSLGPPSPPQQPPAYAPREYSQGFNHFHPQSSQVSCFEVWTNEYYLLWLLIRKNNRCKYNKISLTFSFIRKISL